MTLGILGSMVWDRIDHPDGDRVERWGGIAYSLAAAAAALPAGWVIRPIAKLGRDLAREARAFMDALPGVDAGPGLLETPEPNNRVHLRYRDRHHRHEHLTGGVPPWRWDELAPRIDGLDALYVNLISGFELDLPVARRLRAVVGGPVYADLHSLLLDVGAGGDRVPRPLEDADGWLGAFDVVQVNESELELVAGGDDPWATAERAVRAGLGAILITRGPDGVTIVAPHRGPAPWRTDGGEPRRWMVPLAGARPSGDPTGCGDVWGATSFVALVRGQPLESAVRAANAAAARNVEHRGADGLHAFLAGAA